MTPEQTAAVTEWLIAKKFASPLEIQHNREPEQIRDLLEGRLRNHVNVKIDEHEKSAA